MDWNWFDIVSHVHGPNLLLAFAPNDISFHGVRLQRGDNHVRTVVRGFIARKGYRDTTIVDDEQRPAGAS
jgi:hypothetical protein